MAVHVLKRVGTCLIVLDSLKSAVLVRQSDGGRVLVATTTDATRATEAVSAATCRVLHLVACCFGVHRGAGLGACRIERWFTLVTASCSTAMLEDNGNVEARRGSLVLLAPASNAEEMWRIEALRSPDTRLSRGAVTRIIDRYGPAPGRLSAMFRSARNQRLHDMYVDDEVQEWTFEEFRCLPRECEADEISLQLVTLRSMYDEVPEQGQLSLRDRFKPMPHRTQQWATAYLCNLANSTMLWVRPRPTLEAMYAVLRDPAAVAGCEYGRTVECLLLAMLERTTGAPTVRVVVNAVTTAQRMAHASLEALRKLPPCHALWMPTDGDGVAFNNALVYLRTRDRPRPMMIRSYYPDTLGRGVDAMLMVRIQDTVAVFAVAVTIGAECPLSAAGQATLQTWRDLCGAEPDVHFDGFVYLIPDARASEWQIQAGVPEDVPQVNRVLRYHDDVTTAHMAMRQRRPQS